MCQILDKYVSQEDIKISVSVIWAQKNNDRTNSFLGNNNM